MKRDILAYSLLYMIVASQAQIAEIYRENNIFLDLYGRPGFNISDKKTGNTQGDFDGRLGVRGRQAINDKNIITERSVSFGGSSASENFYHTGLRYEF